MHALWSGGHIVAESDATEILGMRLIRLQVTFPERIKSATRDVAIAPESGYTYRGIII